MQLLDLGRGFRERVGECDRVADAAAVEPAAKLALLATRDRGDARRVVRVALHERERLQDRVVDARGDLCALLRAGCAPDVPRQSCQTHGPSTSSSVPTTAPGPMNEFDAPTWSSSVDRADHHQHDRELRQRPVLADRAAADEDHDEAGDDQPDAEHAAPEQPSATSSEAAARDQRRSRATPAARRRTTQRAK